MVIVFAGLLILHALIHLLGTAKAFGWAELPQLTQPISPVGGAIWFASAALFFAAAVSLFVWPKGWWAIGAAAIVLSTIAIIASWADAKVGALANVIVLAGVVSGFLSYGPFSLRAKYGQDVSTCVSAPPSPQPITDADLAHLPAPVQRYLRTAGVVGQPRVHNFRVRLHGRIRSDSRARWMPLEAEQYNVLKPAARMFYLTSSMFGIPAQGYHRYVGASASMLVKAAALVPVASGSGPEMTQSETVTLFNDMCLMAPVTLVDPSITWQPIDDRRVRARFTNAGHTIEAELMFNEAGELTNFVSGDRYALGPDGTMRLQWWSTPVSGYRQFGPFRLFSQGEGRWHAPDGEYAYIELTLDEVQYNVQPR